MTLAALLQLMEEVDGGLADLTPEQMRDIAQQAEVKVDSYAYMIEKFESEAARLDGRIKAFQEAKKSAIAKAESLRSLIAHHMQANGLTQMPGQDYRVSLRRSESVKVNTEPNADMYCAFAEYIRTKYEWDKAAVKQALKSGNTELEAFAKVVEGVSPQFQVKRALS
jgi:phage host-nuclease inhibitor protein Gam